MTVEWVLLEILQRQLLTPATLARLLTAVNARFRGQTTAGPLGRGAAEGPRPGESEDRQLRYPPPASGNAQRHGSSRLAEPEPLQRRPTLETQS